MRVRDATIGDLEAIATVAVAAGQDEEWTGADPAYVGHLLSCGRVVVAEHRGAVTGFGAIRRIGSGPEETTMLCDLFVDPRSHGLGAGRAMLAALWRDGSRRMPFSSVHSHALSLYTRSGLDDWWPLLYLGCCWRIRLLSLDSEADRRKRTRAGRSKRGAGDPTVQTGQVDCGGGEEMLQSRLGGSSVA